ncbi:MAG: hypothetical protein AAGH89_14970 [Verrucomicrobiota bacterium]
MIFSALMFVFLILAMMIQEFLPVMSLGSIKILFLMPWSFFYVIALTVPYPVMLFFALATGLMWDARHGLPLESPLPFGTRVILFALMGSFMQGIRPLFQRGHWFLPVIMVGLAVLFQRISEFLLICFTAGDFQFSAEIWMTMIATAGAAMLIAPFLLIIISRVAKRCGYQLEFEQFMFKRAYSHGHQI